MGTSLVVQWLRLPTSNAGDSGSIPCWGAKIRHAVQSNQKISKEGFAAFGETHLAKWTDRV